MILLHHCACAISRSQLNPDEVTVDTLTGNNMPVIMTSDVQRSIDTFSAWLDADNKQPFIVVGPDGCGKG